MGNQELKGFYIKDFIECINFCRWILSVMTVLLSSLCSPGHFIAENVIRLLLQFSACQLLLQLKWNLLHIERWPPEKTLLFLRHLKISSRSQNVRKFWGLLAIVCFDKCFLIVLKGQYSIVVEGMWVL